MPLQKVLTLWVSLESLPHKHALKIRMTFESYPHKVVNFSFLGICRRIETGYRRHRRILSPVTTRFDHQAVIVRRRSKVLDDFEIIKVINSSNMIY